jgi:hypothetical protein
MVAMTLFDHLVRTVRVLLDPHSVIEAEERALQAQAEARVPEVLPAWVGDRTERIRQEILMVAPNFTKHEGVEFDEENCDWLMIPKYPLPEKLGARWSKLLIIFPNAYPITPPIGFYLNRKFRLKDGGTDSHLIGSGHHGAADLQAQGWFWYCVRLNTGTRGGWRPSPDYREPDNLFTFLATAREVLTND